MPSRASRQFNELVNGERTGTNTGSVPKNMREGYGSTSKISISPEVQKVINETELQIPDVFSTIPNTQVVGIQPRHESYERGDNPQRPIVSDETLYEQPLTKIADAPSMLLPLADIPTHLHVPMSQDKKDRFYPDGYAKHYFNAVERFKLNDGTEGKLHGQLFVHKADLAGPYYYYIFEVRDANSPKKLYDDKVFYLITPEQFETLQPQKI